jgi:hypothetical protein
MSHGMRLDDAFELGGNTIDLYATRAYVQNTLYDPLYETALKFLMA